MAETIAYDPKFEYGRFERYTERWRGLLQQYNKDMQAAYKNNEQDRVIAYYQEVPYLMTFQVLKYVSSLLMVVVGCASLLCQ